MKNLELIQIKDFFEGSAEFNHPYWGYVGENFLVASTSHSLISSMAGQSVGLGKREDLISFNDISTEYESSELFKKIINNFSFALIADHVVRRNNSSLDGYVDEKIVILSTSKELLKDSFSHIKSNYINKYSQCIDLKSFRPDQINFRIKELIVDNKSVLGAMIFNTKVATSKMDQYLKTIIDVYGNHDNKKETITEEQTEA